MSRIRNLIRRAGGKLSDAAGGITVADLRQRLYETQDRLRLRKQDSVELENLYRQTMLPSIPPRDGRADDLFELVGTTIGEALYIVDCLHKAMSQSGDICEFGVAQGATSQLLAKEIMNTDRHLWLYDSFEGLPKPHEKDELIDDIFGLGSMEAYHGQMKCPEELVLQRLERIKFPAKRTHIRKGWVDQTLATDPRPDKVCFAYVDFDFYKPIKDALEYLDAHMTPGCWIVVDDYGYFSSGVKTAIDEFLSEGPRAYEVTLPTPAAGHFCMLRKLPTQA